MIFDLGVLEEEVKKLEEEVAKEGFWEDGGAAQQILKKRAQLLNTIEKWQSLSREAKENQILMELVSEEGDLSMMPEVEASLGSLEEKVNQLEIETLFKEPHDKSNAIVSIHPGAGGTESQDWAEMLLNMYLKWAEKRGHKTETMDLQAAEEAGLKSVTFSVVGRYAYGYLKTEAGVHRLVRISPFDYNKRRHTSFASVSVYPDIEEEIEIDIDESDLRIDTFRSSGAGGQHVNVTDSAVRITHLPSGIVVQCQNERSQHRNKATALKILKARLYELELRRQTAKLATFHKDKKEIAWGSQIRSYVLAPYRLAKDHRTGLEIGNVDAVLGGEIHPFMQAYLRQRAKIPIA